MSQISTATARPRSASSNRRPKPVRMPEEYMPKAAPLKTRAHSGLKIEDKLLNYHAQTKKRLEALKKTLEQDKLKELQEKPKITEKSRILAEIYERKYFQQLIEAKEIPKTTNTQKITLENPTEPKEFTINHLLPNKITVESIPFTQKESVPTKKRVKSLLNLSALEKNNPCIDTMKEDGDDSHVENGKNSLAECTFSPLTVTKNIAYKNLGESCNNSFVSTPLSVETFTDCSENQVKNNNKPKGYKVLAPFQVKVSFKCGIDLRSFLKRAK